MNLFKDLIDIGLLDTDNKIHLELVRYCFLNIIQQQLNNTKKHWNLHTIRKMKNNVCPSGIPNVLYECPSLYKTEDFKFSLCHESLMSLEKELCKSKEYFLVEKEIKELFDSLLDAADMNKNFTEINECVEVFYFLSNEIKNI